MGIIDLMRRGVSGRRVAELKNVSHWSVLTTWRRYISDLAATANTMDRRHERVAMREMYSAAADRALADAQACRAAGDMQDADRAERRLLAILESVRKLTGLDDPTQIDVDVSGTIGHVHAVTVSDIEATASAIMAALNGAEFVEPLTVDLVEDESA